MVSRSDYEDIHQKAHYLEEENKKLKNQVEDLLNDDIAQQMAALKSDNDFLRSSVAELQSRITKILSPRF